MKLVKPKLEKQSLSNKILKTLFYIYLVGVLFVTMMPIAVNIFGSISILLRGFQSMSMWPFDDLIRGRSHALEQILLNILMMIPMGLMLPLIYKTKFMKTVGIVFLCSLSIELIQPYLMAGRASDITDIITNTSGGVIGYQIYIILRPILNKLVEKVDQI